MGKHSFLRVCVVMVAVGVSACTSLPEASRTATVHDVKVDLELSPEQLSVSPGDEVRWVNLRKENIYVQIPDLNIEELSCQKGFTNWLGQIQESVKVNADQTVSLCFKKPAVILYNVRAETTIGGGKRVFSGSIQVGKTQGM